eukprot:405095-Prymnesium_polylepis.2
MAKAMRDSMIQAAMLAKILAWPAGALGGGGGCAGGSGGGSGDGKDGGNGGGGNGDGDSAPLLGSPLPNSLAA